MTFISSLKVRFRPVFARLRLYFETWVLSSLRIQRTRRCLALDLARAYVPYGLITWIGLYVPPGAGKWAWADGSTVNYTNWNTGEPNGGGLTGCTHMYTDYADVAAIVKGVWNDNGCNVNGHSALCSKKVDVHF